VIKTDVFDEIEDVSHIETFEQLFHCTHSIIIMTDIKKR